MDPMPIPAASTTAQVHKSKFGYHCCDYQTFLKLKKLMKAYHKTYCQLKTWYRWANKAPHNRVIKKYIRNEKGWKIGKEFLDPVPAPTYDQRLVSYDLDGARYARNPFTAKWQWLKVGYPEMIRFPVHSPTMTIMEAYQAARKPYASPASVVPMMFSVSDIDRLLALLES